MDELLQHCLQELAFSGDLGCNVSRLRDFVYEFYTSHISMHQTLDDEYYAFVWSLVAQHPSVRIGVLPDGDGTDVYIPPQPRVSKKDKGGKDEILKENAMLGLIPDANRYSLNELVQSYGDRLRMAVDSETCFAALTGSHAKPAKLTPMVYAALQIIARSRESGTSVLELGKTTGYDQKTCFYLVKQLLELGFIVKLRRGGNSQNFCVHKYFFDRSPLWKNVHEEELRAQEESIDNARAEDIVRGAGAFQRPQFDPIDTRHLTSLNILRQRLIKLLKYSPEGNQPYANISVKIGFYPRSRTERRFFIVRLNELINEGVIEKFFMSSANPETTQNKQLYLRLTSASTHERPVDNIPKIAEDDEMIDSLVTEDQTEQVQLKSTITLHRQGIDLLQASSTAGATLNELSDRLGSFDKKTLDLLISRMERQAPPPHLADLSVVQILETHGRERRYRFFSLGGYSELMKREGFEPPPYLCTLEDLAKAGGFIADRVNDFYRTRDELQAFYKKWSGARVHRFSVPSGDDHGKSLSRTRSTTLPVGSVTSRVSPKKWTNPMLPDGTRKRGRPPKDRDGIAQRASKRIKNKSEEDARDESVAADGQSVPVERIAPVPDKLESVKRKRGEIECENVEAETADTLGREILSSALQVVSKRKRGRPPKKKRMDVTDGISTVGPTNGLLQESQGECPEDIALRAKDSRFPEVPSSSAFESAAYIAFSRSAQESASQTASPTITAVDNTALTGSALPRHSPPPFGHPTNTSAIPSVRDLREASPTVYSVNNEALTGGNPESHSASSRAGYQTGLASSLLQSRLTGELNDDATRVLASLAAQVNASFSANSPSDGIGSVVTALPDFVHSAVTCMTPENGNRDSGLDNAQVDTGQSVRATDSQKVEDDGSRSAVASLKKSKRSGRYERKANLSAMRRENELIHLIENASGIINTSSTVFLTSYVELIEATVKAGEAASAPIGARSDRRTLNYTLDKLEETGRIKTITTNIASVTGAFRSAKVAFLPTVTEERVREWLSLQGLSELVPLPKEELSERLEGTDVDLDSPRGLAKQWLHSKGTHEIHQDRWHRNPHRAEQLFGQSDAVIREAMLIEKQTLSQMYGYLTGKIMRARELHLYTLEQFERDFDYTLVVSRDERIVNRAFFETYISLATHCACITASAFVPAIRDALDSDEGRNRLVKDIPDEWKQALDVGKARSRDRIFDLLDYLHSLRLVIPLRRYERVDSSGVQGSLETQVSTSFEPMPSDWASKVPLVRPEYWQFRSDAPLYLLALQRNPAPFWKTVSTASRANAEIYWTELKSSCLNKSFAENVQQTAMSSDASYSGEQRVATALRRPSSWSADYTLSWYQTQYLKRFVNVHNGNTPLQSQGSSEALLQEISGTVHAPLDVVKGYFRSSREATLRELDKRHHRETHERLEKKETDLKLLLARKRLEAAKSRETAWAALVEKAHPGLVKGVAATRLRKLRQSYIQGNVIQDNHHWELQIVDAIKAAEKMRCSRKLFPNVSQASHGPVPRMQLETDQSQLPSASQGKSVEFLISMQENMVINGGEEEDKGRKGKRKAGSDKGKGKERTRRQRFQWNADYDELEWAALDQIFPSVPKSSVRARVSVLKDQPGADAYLQRLENCWHELWVKKRGTNELPDPNPRDPTEFDLKSHLQYLRKRVDKNAIRVGVSTLEDAEYTPLPKNPGNFISMWNVVERRSPYSSWDFLSDSTIGEEVREKLFLQAAFILESDVFPNEGYKPEVIRFAEAALKVVVGTPDDSYNANNAAALLHAIGDDNVDAAMDNLLSANVLSKLIRDPTRSVPGRTVKMSEMNQNALGGPIAKDLFVDASQLDKSYGTETDELREWPLTSAEGDTAALLQRFSDHQVEFHVDTSHAQATRASIDGNSRKVDDDDIELSLRVKLKGFEIPPEPTPKQLDEGSINSADLPDHGTSIFGEKACCSLRADGVVDCLKCIEEARTQMNKWSENDRSIGETILRVADVNEKQGIEIEKLRDLVDSRHDTFASGIHSLHSLRLPLLYLVGYDSPIAVSAKYAGSWAITLPGENVPVSRIFPRRWIDLKGNRMTLVWEAGLRAVAGTIHLRPGISQAELRRLLRAVYDRQEILDLLKYLVSRDALRLFCQGEWQSERTVCIDALSKEEEKDIFWAVHEGMKWYRIS